MGKPKLLLIAYRAFGDWCYAAPVLPYLLEKYEVYLETNLKGMQLFHDDPRFAKVSVFNFESIPQAEWPEAFVKRWKEVNAELKPDKEINLNATLEVHCISERDYDGWDWPLAARRTHFGSRNFYEETFKRCEIPFPEELNTEGLYFTQEQLSWAEQWRDSNKGKFTVIVPAAGSTMHKTFHNYQQIVWAALNLDESSQVYVAGDVTLKAKVIKHKRVFDMCTDVPIKQAFLMTKYADFMVGPETSLMAAAGMWGTPKMMLATTSSVDQMTKYQKNDYSMQSPIFCSPCHRAVYKEEDCQTRVYSEKGEFLTPACAKMFNLDNIQGTLFNVYKKWRAHQEALAGNLR